MANLKLRLMSELTKCGISASILGTSINEEALIKLGFKKYDVKGNRYYIVAGKFHIQFEKGTCYLNYHKLDHIKFMYHLQDLYFVLTGKELELK